MNDFKTLSIFVSILESAPVVELSKIFISLSPSTILGNAAPSVIALISSSTYFLFGISLSFER